MSVAVGPSPGIREAAQHLHELGFVPATTVMRLTVLEMTAKSNLHKLNDPNMHGLDE